MLFLKSTLRWKQNVLILSAATVSAGFAYNLLKAEQTTGGLALWEVWSGTALVFLVAKILLSAIARAFWRRLGKAADRLRGKDVGQKG